MVVHKAECFKQMVACSAASNSMQDPSEHAFNDIPNNKFNKTKNVMIESALHAIMRHLR